MVYVYVNQGLFEELLMIADQTIARPSDFFAVWLSVGTSLIDGL